MKKTASTRLVLYSLGMLMLGCQKEEPMSDPSVPGTVTIETAREWYAHHLAPAKGNQGRGLPQRVPSWNSAQRITLDDGRPAVDVPLQYQSKGIGAGGLTRLLLYEKQGRWQARIMKMVSDSGYFHANGQHINLENFTGVLMLYDWQENFLTGAGLSNGKVTGTVSKPHASARAGGGCGFVTITHYVRVCIAGDCMTRVDYEETYLECSGGGGGGGGGGEPLPTGPIGGGGGGGGGAPGQPVPYTFLKPRIGYTIPGQDKPPIDLSKYLDCFGAVSATDSYRITVYVDEPEAGSGRSKSGLNVGHTFIGFKATPAGGAPIQQVFGFYPRDYASGWVGSKFSDNGGSPYTMSVTFAVTPQQYQQALDAALYMTREMYNIENRNCTDAVFFIVDAMGVEIPKNKSAFPLGMGTGHSPGQLGLDLRNQASRLPVNTTAGNAPASKGPC